PFPVAKHLTGDDVARAVTVHHDLRELQVPVATILVVSRRVDGVAVEAEQDVAWKQSAASRAAPGHPGDERAPGLALAAEIAGQRRIAVDLPEELEVGEFPVASRRMHGFEIGAQDIELFW